MKKTLSLVLVAVMMLSMAITTSAVHSGTTTAVFGTPEAIDGVLDAAWTGANSIVVADLCPGDDDIGEEASSATVYTMWDGEYLYFFADVTDMTPDGEVKDALWDQDACGFMVNYDYDSVIAADEGQSYRDADPAYAGYVNVAPTFDAPEAHSQEASTIFADQKYYDAVKSYVVQTDKGWAVEIRIPLSLYKTFAEGDKIGFEICLNESIGMGGRDAKRAWVNNEETFGSDSWTNPTHFGTLILGAAAAAADAPAADDTAADETVDAPAADADETVDAPAADTTVTAPQTFDVAVIAAVASVLSLAGFAISKKH